MPSRQSIASREKRAAAALAAGRAPGTTGRARWRCETHGEVQRRRNSKNEYLCPLCHPPKGRGRPRRDGEKEGRRGGETGAAGS